MPPCPPPIPSLADALRDRTKTLHAAAERSGVLHALVRGHAGPAAYALYLRNLLPAYRALAARLKAYGAEPAVQLIAEGPNGQAARLRRDIAALAGAGWERALPLVPAAEAYADRIVSCSAASWGPLLAHAYTRYLGDLNGDAILRRLLEKRHGAMSLAAVPRDRGRQSASAYRQAIDMAGAFVTDPAPVLLEAEAAFRMTITVSEAVQAAA
ncbi:MAG: biliverdin-producing heme oxygenase [Proteobacteria bacterium]|nr:biliverdin-producing heme oxygenase [Pseudomonadota bacterium]